MVSMFLDEARLAARLNHPNVVQTYEVGEEDGGYFIVDGVPRGAAPQPDARRASRRRAGRSRPSVWAKIVSDALAGLHYAHELADYDGTPLHDRPPRREPAEHLRHVRRRGEARRLRHREGRRSNITETETGILKGKLAYMAPEQARGAARSTGAPTSSRWGSSSGSASRDAAHHGRREGGGEEAGGHEVPAARRARTRPSRPSSTRSRCARSSATRPARYQTAEEMRDALEGYLRAERPLRAGVGDRRAHREALRRAAGGRARADPHAHGQPALGAQARRGRGRTTRRARRRVRSTGRRRSGASR